MLPKVLLHFFLACFLFHPFSADAQKVKRKGSGPLMKKNNQEVVPDSFFISQFAGKWQENKRLNRNSRLEEEIQDTLYLHFENNKVNAREGNKPNLKGEASIDNGNILIAAADVYTIQSVKADTIILDDNDLYIHIFLKKNYFWYEAVGKDSIKQETFNAAISYEPHSLAGNWDIYKKEAKPGTINPSSAILKSLHIDPINNDTLATGSVIFYTGGTSEETLCKFRFYKTSIQIEAEKHNWFLPVCKAGKKELILGSAEMILYYCRAL